MLDSQKLTSLVHIFTNNCVVCWSSNKYKSLCATSTTASYKPHYGHLNNNFICYSVHVSIIWHHTNQGNLPIQIVASRHTLHLPTLFWDTPIEAEVQVCKAIRSLQLRCRFIARSWNKGVRTGSFPLCCCSFGHLAVPGTRENP